VVGIGEDANNCAERIVNVEHAKRVEVSIRQSLRDGISPRPSIEVVSLPVFKDTVIVVRVAPQNPPHMVSTNKRSDFYGRYDATSERMRYEEIEQRFRDKFSQGELPRIEDSRVLSPRALLDTLSGRREVLMGTADAFQQFGAKVVERNQPSLSLIAIQENAENAVTEPTAKFIFTEPSYARKGGWTVIHTELPFRRSGGNWEHDYGESSRTSLNASGDFIFQKSIDEVLCWRQDEVGFLRQPRLYSNSLIEYCLSYIYSVADVASITKPKLIYVKPMIVVDERGVKLPLGEGGRCGLTRL
jgi:hypothetical protein